MRAQAAEVWPTVDKRTLARAFERLRQQQVSFQDCRSDMRGETRAQATVHRHCAICAEGGESVGAGRQSPVEVLPGEGDEQWRIESVEAR
jgi:hypothetical protein